MNRANREKPTRTSRAVRPAPDRRSAVVRQRVVTGALAAALLVVASVWGVNYTARYLALRQAKSEASPGAQAAKARENVLIISSSETGAEFLAVRLDEVGGQIQGIAIPGGAFMEVPGTGFGRIGDSYSSGVGVSLAAISNFLGVPFEHYVVVGDEDYRDALTNQSLRAVMSNLTESDLTAEEQAAMATFIDTVPGERTALVPLPVSPVELADRTLFEPQRDKIADLLLQWWGVKSGVEAEAVSVIVYNGVGSPGLAGDAAQELLAGGFRVVDTGNAERFDYDTTLIVVQNGIMSQGDDVRAALGVGEVEEASPAQDVADVIVIIGKDYAQANAEL